MRLDALHCRVSIGIVPVARRILLDFLYYSILPSYRHRQTESLPVETNPVFDLNG
jgi:hypothetical protein